ncbi:hypothetical protein ACA910_000894 [Epithemia clementina (nom. ined.)]
MLNSLYWLPSWQLAAEKEEAAKLRGLAGSTDDEGLTAEEEDRIAAELLSQFPPFGSHEPKDWLSLGYAPSFVADDDMFDNADDGLDGLPDNSVLMQQRKNVPTKRDSGGSDRNPNGHSRANKVSRKDDWDEDEQVLWKKGGQATANSTTPSRANSSRHIEQPSKQMDWVDRGRHSSSKNTENKIPNLQGAHLVSSISAAVQSNKRRDGPDASTPLHNKDPSETRRKFSLLSPPPVEADSLPQSESRQHWMPDKLCKQCYSCETNFTVFRRRHHCRICGQVFCNQCSAYFVPHKAGATVRVCQMCYEQVTERGGLIEDDSDSHKTGHEQGGATPAGVIIPLKPAENMESVRPTGSAPGFEDPTDASSRGSNLRDIETVLQRLSESNIPKRQSERSINPFSSDSRLPPLSSMEASTGVNALQSAPSPPPLQRKGSHVSSSSNNANTSTASGAASWIPFAGAASNTTAPSTRHLAPPPVPSRTNSLGNNMPPALAMEAIREGNHHLGMCAAEHLENMCDDLLRHHAPLLLNYLASFGQENALRLKKNWINQLLTLATRCCATVEPNVRNGDLLDIRPYCKIKVIPGGSYRDCAYLSGVVFRKTVSHKRMAREIGNPRIMLLSGGIEFTRTENRIASLETLFEQEDKYMEILVGKILKLKPDILMTGRFVSRRAQELLLKAGVVLIQQVKSNLLSRISRQTGATIISSTDHVMNQFGAKVLGTCHRFRLVTFRDNEVWVDGATPTGDSHEGQVGGARKRSGEEETHLGKRSIRDLLLDPTLSTADRQSVLAASKLGEGVHDGAEAVKTGLAKRGVAQTFVMLEGCPKKLGSTIVLRGAGRIALKQVKCVLRFLVLTAYSLRLETSYLKERRARLRPDFRELPKHRFSSSLCVDFGEPPNGRKVRPWNGEDEYARQDGGDITAFDHGAILVTSIWMTEKSQCCPAEVKGICYYSLQDVSLGQFLRDSCFNLSLKCQNPNCKKSVLEHSLSFVHNDGLLNIVVEELDDDLPAHPDKTKGDSNGTSNSYDDDADQPIATWTYCRKCEKMVSALSFISEDTWKFSFGKFLESFFYNRDAILNAPDHNCSCDLQSSALFFGCGRLSARFSYEPIYPFEVFVRTNLPMHFPFHKEETLRRLELISKASSDLFIKFDKHIDRVIREARSLFHSAANRPEHLQTVLSELNRIGLDVDRAAKLVQEKIASVSEDCRRREEDSVSEALLRFPWFARRYLFLLTSSWNEKLRAAGKAITAMKKLSASASSRPDVGGSEAYNDQLNAGIKRLRELNDRYASFNTADMNEALSFLPKNEISHHDEYDDEFEDSEVSIDFADGVDADVLASRRRLHGNKPNLVADRKTRPTPTKSLGTRRTSSETGHISHDSSTTSSEQKSTPGGAVKSALNRFFNRGSRDENAYVVDLGILAEGRPSLPPGVNNIVVPVFDEQWSSIIAYSLSSSEYAKEFKHFSKYGNSFDGRVEGSVLSADSPYGPDNRRLGDDVLGFGSSGLDGGWDEQRSTERRMLVRNKTHIKHTFRDYDGKGQVTCKFVCTTYWATQFHAVRQVFLADSMAQGDDPGHTRSADVEQSYIESLSSTYSWAASGGKSGASFSRTSDDRFVIKCISRTELQMFLDCAPAYFEYLSKAFFHGLPTVLCKIVGVYQIGVHNRATGKRSMEQVAVMQNIFYNRKITKIFDLKGSLRGRFAANIQSNKEHESSSIHHLHPETPNSDVSGIVSKRRTTDSMDNGRDGSVDLDDNGGSEHYAPVEKGPGTLLDGDFLEFTMGRPMPMTDRAKAVFQMSILNDTLFLNIINVLDYSILVGLDEEKMELVVGIIDFMRQYDILKQMERVGKSLPMVVGSEAPTIIQPPLYKARFTNAMERYFMTVPSKWTTI